MFSWLFGKNPPADPEHARALYHAVRRALGDDDDVQVRIVASIAALCACVAYADLEVEPREESVIRTTLSRIQGLDDNGAAAIGQVLRDDVVRITGAEASTYARELLDLTDRAFRRQLLDVLVDIAAADDEITVAETNMLRGIAKSLGLSDATYNAAQARHRDNLAVLKG